MVTENLYNIFLASSGVCTDSRNIQKDCLFIGLKGDNFDGNKFASQALQDGAKFAFVDDEKYKTDDRIELVSDTLEFLQQLAFTHRKKFNIPIIGITGSNGKTSTKELINVALSSAKNVLCTKGNLNNHIGVPLTLLQLNKTHEIAVIEMGANKPGDIAELCAMVEPNIGIITNIGKAHLEGFEDLQGVVNTKIALYKTISALQGTVIYNGDDELLETYVPKSCELIKYGNNKDSNVQGQLLELNPFVKMKYYCKDYESNALQMQMLGDYNYYNYLAAIAVARYFNIPENLYEQALVDYLPTNNRSQIQKTKTNTLILDCYNANPSSMESALRSFGMIANENKFIILGDMLELGQETTSEHKKILELCESLKLKGITVGIFFKSVNRYNSIKSFGTKGEAAMYLNDLNLKDNLILLKGSRGIGLESFENLL